jgi:putative MATE family efflux protein
VYWFFAEPLVGLVGDDTTTIRLGATYLQILSLGLLFNVLNQASSRTLAGADDTWIAMSIRATGAGINIILNAVFIFGLGMGVAGAALGTVIAEGLVTACFVWGFYAGQLPIIGSFPITLSPHRPYFDMALTKQLLLISPPLIGQHLLRTVARFPLFAILALLGPTVVAAFEVARRIRQLMGTPGSGFSMAASGLIGQELGRGDEIGADNYAHDVIWFSVVIYALSVALVFILARPLATVFADNPEVIAQTVPFIQVAAISFLAIGIGKTYSGILRAAGDNRWILYARVMSQYVVLIPLTYVGVLTPLGVRAVFAGLILEGLAMASITGYRFFSDKWKLIGRTHRPDSAA